jgi:hypothetical protein
VRILLVAGVISAVLLGPDHSTRGDEVTTNREGKVFRAGVAEVLISPPKLPVLINGGFIEKSADVVRDPLHARALVLDDGTTRLAIVVVDSCMLPRELIDGAKQLARERTGLQAERILVSATHTHSAPSAMGALGSRPDPDYVAYLPGRIAEVIDRAIEALVPAQIGWGVVDDFEHTHCRRWIRRPDRILLDPFGDRTVRANMHPGHLNPDVIAPAGPVDPGLSLLAVQTLEGRPLGVLANYSMHYFGASPVSADYFGIFAHELAGQISDDRDDRHPVVMMSQGTSGDQQWMDYAGPKDASTIDAYARSMARRALEVYRTIVFRPWAELAMAETRLTLRRRVPDERRLAWARPIAAAMGERVPKDQKEVYAREALHLYQEPERELKLQAIRVGALGIAAIPNEVYALSGLKLKAQSPLAPTFVIELANGSEGYIPPPEQHALGGYTTWPARTAALEVQAEPRIVAAMLGLLEDVSGLPRRAVEEPDSAYAREVLASSPLAYWRLGEMAGGEAVDATGHGHRAIHEGCTAYYLEGPRLSDTTVINRAVHLAGGHLSAELRGSGLGRTFSVELWFWNGLPNAARAMTGDLLSWKGAPEGAVVDRLMIGGNRNPAETGRLVLSNGGRPVFTGSTEISLRTWHHVVLVRQDETVTVFLDGERELGGESAWPDPPFAGPLRFLFGGGLEADASFEGKLDEIAVYGRALTPAKIADRFRFSVGP